MKRAWRDIPVIVAAIFLVGLFAYLFYREGSVRDADPRGEALGTITYRYHTAQRKATDTVLWHDLDQNQNVYNLDWLRTDDGSEATLNLIHNTKIHMDQNTMLILELDEERETVDIRTGRVHVDRKEDTSELPFTIRGGVQEILMEKGEADFRFEDGALTVHTGENGASMLRGDEVIRMDAYSIVSLKKGEPAKIGKAISTVSPGPDRTLFIDGDRTTVEFAWKNDGVTIFELSLDRHFKEVIRQDSTRQNSTRETLSPGYYYWRVRSADRPEGIAQRISVAKREVLEPISPAPGERFTYHALEPLIHLSWSNSRFMNRYRLQISQNRDFTQIIYDLTVETDRISVPLNEGGYHWRVIPVLNREEAVGKPRISEFSVIRTRDLPIPILRFPRHNSEVEIGALQGRGVLFLWKTERELVRSEIEISREPRFQEILLRRETRDNYLKVIRDLTPGVYYWRIRSYTDEGRVTPFTPTVSFRVMPSETASAPEEPSAKELVTTEPERKKPGSKEERLPETAELGTAIPISPIGGRLIDMTEANSIQFRWRGASGASAYRFRLIRDGDVVYEEIRTGTAFSFDRLGDLDVGEFTWSIQALDQKSGLESEPQEGKFVITLRETPGMPTGISTDK